MTGITLLVSRVIGSSTDELSIGIMRGSHILRLVNQNAYTASYQRLWPLLYIVAILQYHDSLLENFLELRNIKLQTSQCHLYIAHPPLALFCRSSSPLKPSTGSHDCNALVHYPFSHTKIAIDPFLDLLALGYLVLVDSGAKVP